MQLSQQDLEAALNRDWRVLREAEQLRLLLPPCRTRQWVRDDGIVGYVTLNYDLQRDVALPLAFAESEPSRASLVEKYWAIRTMDGRQDPNWLPSLNVNVIQVTNRPVSALDCEVALRNALLLREAIWHSSHLWFGGDAKKAELYVRAAIVGPAIDQPAAFLAAMDVLREIPLTIARFQFSVAEGFSFVEPPDLERLWSLHVAETAASASFAAALLSEDELPADGFEWKGTNKGPIFDRRLGLTMQDGRFL